MQDFYALLVPAMAVAALTPLLLIRGWDFFCRIVAS